MKKNFLAFGCDVAKIGAFALALGFVACGDDSSSGSDDSSLIPVESEIDLVGGKKVTCDEKMEGVVAALVNGDFRRCEDGAWVKISREEALKTDEILGYSSSSVKAGSSSSAKVTSSSSVKAGLSSSAKVTSSSSAKVVVSSSSGTPAVDPDPVPEIYECPDGSFVEVEEDCPTATTSSSDAPDIDPDVNPGEVPGSNSSTSEDDVKPDGYYSNSSKCPAGLTCKYATTTDYLNSSKTYGEILDTRDGQVYKTIEICDKDNKNCQTWMAQNLNYAPTNVSSMGDYAWSGCYGEGSEGFTEEQVAANCSKYGRLYTWEVAMDKAGCGYGTYCNNSYEGTQGVCPAGWRLPTKEDWQKLVKPMATSVEDYGYYNGAGIELKTVDDWYSSSDKGTNVSGFSALPAGGRDYAGNFNKAGLTAYFWSASEGNDYGAYYLYLYYDIDYADLDYSTKYDAFSVRCVQNSPDQGGEISSSSIDASSSSSEMLSEQSSSSMTLVGSSSSIDASSSSSSTPIEDPGTSSGVIPSTDPESPSEVKADGYYSNSSSCPASLTCKYAATTEYLNTSKTYGEILDTRDGQVYKTIEICDNDNKNCQTWMAQNLNYTPDPEKVSSMGDYAWSGCYDNQSTNCSKYGRLYTWEVAMDKAGCGYDGTYCNNSNEGAQGVCPSGWHLPTKEDWQKLVKPMANSVDDYTTCWYYNGAGVELKSVEDWYEYSTSTKETNASGFSALPASGRYVDVDFNYVGYSAYFWSASEDDDGYAYYLYLYYQNVNAYLYRSNKNNAFSVRCVQN